MHSKFSADKSSEVSSDKSSEVSSEVSTKISNVKLATCLMNASGCWCTSEAQLSTLASISSIGACVSKSGTFTPREGNPEPRLYVDEKGGVINSMGIPNHGYLSYITYFRRCTQREGKGKQFIQSICPFDLNELEIMLYEIDKHITTADIGFPLRERSRRMIEVDLSCPNLTEPRTDLSFPQRLEMTVHKMSLLCLEDLILGIKMPPLFDLDTFHLVADILLRYRNTIRFLVCTNSIPNGLMVDYRNEKTRIHPRGGLGGISGVYIKPISLANVYNFSRLLGDKIDIIGCGGVCTGQDVFEYILCGAKAVQIGSCLLNEGPGCFDRILKEFVDIMEKKGYRSITEIVGRIKVSKL